MENYTSGDYTESCEIDNTVPTDIGRVALENLVDQLIDEADALAFKQLHRIANSLDFD